MEKIEEILPRLNEYLSKDLARENLSPVAEATRLFYVERIRALDDAKEGKRHANSTNSQIQQLRNILVKKLAGDATFAIQEKKNGFSKIESHTNSTEQKSEISTTHNGTNHRVSQNGLDKTEIVDEYYDSEFDSSDEGSVHSSPVNRLSSEKSAINDDLFASALFKGDFYQNILLKMRLRTCYIVNSELICVAKSKVRSRFSVINCRTNVKQHETKYPVEVRLEPACSNLISLYTTDSQMAWRFVKAIREAGGSTKDEKRISHKDLDGQSSSTQSSETFENEKNDSLSTDNIKTKVQNFFGTIGKKEKSTDCDSALIPLLCVHG